MQLNLLDALEEDCGGFDWPCKDGRWILTCRNKRQGYAASVSKYKTFSAVVRKAFTLINETPEYWEYISIGLERGDRNV